MKRNVHRTIQMTTTMYLISKSFDYYFLPYQGVEHREREKERVKKNQKHCTVHSSAFAVWKCGALGYKWKIDHHHKYPRKCAYVCVVYTRECVRYMAKKKL